MPELDHLIVDQITALSEDESNPVTILSNASALLYDTMPDLNWAGFYLYSKANDSLDLGPFQGKVACTHIKPGTGVVGTSFRDKQSLIVPNVHEFAGHIACDAASNAEIVAPLVANDGTALGVLDIDSPSLNRFSKQEQTVLVDFAAALTPQLDAAKLAAVY